MGSAFQCRGNVNSLSSGKLGVRPHYHPLLGQSQLQFSTSTTRQIYSTPTKYSGVNEGNKTRPRVKLLQFTWTVGCRSYLLSRDYVGEPTLSLPMPIARFWVTNGHDSSELQEFFVHFIQVATKINVYHLVPFTCILPCTCISPCINVYNLV